MPFDVLFHTGVFDIYVEGQLSSLCNLIRYVSQGRGAARGWSAHTTAPLCNLPLNHKKGKKRQLVGSFSSQDGEPTVQP